VFAFLDAPVAGAYHLVLPIAGALSPALAIVLCTIAVRLALHPLARKAAKGEKIRAELAPKIQELQRKYGKDRARFQRELATLQQNAGASMFAGCLPLLAQLPFFMVMYRLFSSTTIDGGGNQLLSVKLFNAELGAHWLSAPGSPVFLALFAALAVVAWFSARLIPSGTGRIVRLMPYGTLLGAAVIPLAAGIYLLTSTAWATAERAYLRRGR
jgi:YidC/Oxa1 family membrane protein insertase